MERDNATEFGSEGRAVLPDYLRDEEDDRRKSLQEVRQMCDRVRSYIGEQGGESEPRHPVMADSMGGRRRTTGLQAGEPMVDMGNLVDMTPEVGATGLILANPQYLWATGVGEEERPNHHSLTG